MVYFSISALNCALNDKNTYIFKIPNIVVHLKKNECHKFRKFVSVNCYLYSNIYIPDLYDRIKIFKSDSEIVKLEDLLFTKDIIVK